jgi:hypothetical protein
MALRQHQQTMAPFVFSDDELFDVLTDIADDAAGIALFERNAPGSLPPVNTANHGTLAAHGFAIPSDSHIALNNFAVNPRANAFTADADDSGSTDSSSEQSNRFEQESVADESSSPTKKPSRKRRKHELDIMRALASSLESQLDGLKEKHHRNDEPGATVFWKRVADQLLLDRQRSTTENARLRELFQDQTKVLKSVQRTLLKSPDLEVQHALLKCAAWLLKLAIFVDVKLTIFVHVPPRNLVRCHRQKRRCT